MKYASNNVGLKSILGILSFIGLSACGGSGQDDGRSLAINQNIAGTVVDGYVARGTVYFDSNE